MKNEITKNAFIKVFPNIDNPENVIILINKETLDYLKTMDLKEGDSLHLETENELLIKSVYLNKK